jgi:hypothetical protein
MGIVMGVNTNLRTSSRSRVHLTLTTDLRGDIDETTATKKGVKS